LRWQLAAEGVDETDNDTLTKNWLLYFSSFTLQQQQQQQASSSKKKSLRIITIVKSGYLLKRGKYNKAYKLRWFVLASNSKVINKKFKI
jgi:hypothetical protein